MSATTTLTSRIDNAKEYISRNFDPLDSNNYSYFYTGRSVPWDDEYSPDVATSDFQELVEHRLQRIFMKQITTDECTLAIKRFNWVKWTVYSRADYDVEYTDYRNWVHPEQPFYVMNSEGNIYKCISNNHGGESSNEPTGQSLEYIYLGDGYVWKFMLAITTTIEDLFLTDTWIPIPDDDLKKDFVHTQVEDGAVVGDIAYIQVTNGGESYNGTPIVQIRGDGNGAEATAIMNGESVAYIDVTNKGSGYTIADVFIYGNGIDATATAMVAPPGGHGSDAVQELGAFYVETSMEIVGDEDTLAPIVGTYRNVGVIKNPYDTLGVPLTSEKTNTLSDVNVTACSGTYLAGEMIIGQDSRSQGRVYYDPSGETKTIQMYMMLGEFTDGEDIHGQDTGVVGTYTSSGSAYTDVDIWTGEIIYLENIKFITRRLIQIERFVFTVEF
jgi:hypothetical protein